MESYSPPALRVNEPSCDYLSADDLLALGIDSSEAATILRHSPLSGHGSEPVIEAEHLAELLDGGNTL